MNDTSASIASAMIMTIVHSLDGIVARVVPSAAEKMSHHVSRSGLVTPRSRPGPLFLQTAMPSSQTLDRFDKSQTKALEG